MDSFFRLLLTASVAALALAIQAGIVGLCVAGAWRKLGPESYGVG
jgi:hypothetical protein